MLRELNSTIENFIKNMKNKKTLKINKKKIFENSLPYMIAEIGVNHENSLLIAKKMINQAKISGFSAVKFQNYKAENKILKRDLPSFGILLVKTIDLISFSAFRNLKDV